MSDSRVAVRDGGDARGVAERVGIRLDEAGWVAVDELLEGCRRAGQAMTREELAEIVRTNEKQRFALSADGSRIRANQGHSVPVDLGLPPVTPPDRLYHGTSAGALTVYGVFAASTLTLASHVRTGRRVGGGFEISVEVKFPRGPVEGGAGVLPDAARDGGGAFQRLVGTGFPAFEIGGEPAGGATGPMGCRSSVIGTSSP